MRIVFLCGSLEPGRDGVGDYSRRMAGELIKQGHQAAIIALHDKYLQREIVKELQRSELQEINTLRLSCQLSWKERTIAADEFIKSVNPEWLSLQYVSFSFHEKGMPYVFTNVLRQLSKGKKLHIIFHEIWVGIESDASLKMRLWGYVQKMIINRMLGKIKFDVIHTQAKYYLHMLVKLGYDVQLLPLFGNIPVSQSRKYLEVKNCNDLLTFVVFGGIHEGALIREFSNDLASYAHLNKINIKFLFIGINGDLRDEWVSILTEKSFLVEIIGEQITEVISEFLLKFRFGITTTPLLLSDKSGSVAAMLEHGMDVICIRPQRQMKFNLSSSDYQVSQYTVGAIDQLLSVSKLPYTMVNSINTVASTFLNVLDNEEITYKKSNAF